MRRPGKGVERFAGWLLLSSAAVLILYLPEVYAFFDLLNSQLNENFGTAFPAIPFAALLAALFALRWGDLSAVLSQEGAMRTHMRTRAVGLVLVLSPLAITPYSVGSLELSAATLVLVFYGVALALNPLTSRILLPYAALCAAGVTVPSAIEYLFGEPLAGLSSSLSAAMVALSGIPVTWQGTQFEFVSKVGGVVSATVTPGCSSVLSVTTFLGLLGLMYFDMRRELSATVKLAVVGVVCLVFLNSARILILIWAGYMDGAAALWGLHNWIGYAIFIGFYLVVLVVYSRMKPAGGAGGAAGTALRPGTGSGRPDL